MSGLGYLAYAKIRKLMQNKGVGHEEPQFVEILPKTTVDVVFYEEEGMAFGILPYIQEEYGIKAKVAFDGVAYDTEYRRRVAGDSQGTESIFDGFGNLAFLGLEDTGEPFLIVPINEEQGTFLICKEGTHTISIAKETSVVHTIDPKFLPSGAAPRKVIDLDEYHGTDNNIDETNGLPVSQCIGAIMMGYPETTYIGLRGGNIPALKKMLCENENVSVLLSMGDEAKFIAHSCQTWIHNDGENTIRRHGFTCFIDVTGEWKLYCLYFICYTNTDGIDIDIKHVFA